MTQTERQIAGANIRRRREAEGLSVTKLAAELDIERTYFYDIENGTANVTFEKFERIAEYFRVTVRDLLEPPPRGGKRSELAGSRR
jgi:transcriptional regulator with XRE-family HTH domain